MSKIIQVNNKRSVSRSGLTQNYEIIHPETLRRCFVWLPISQVIELPYNEIKVPMWLWNSTNKKLKEQEL